MRLTYLDLSWVALQTLHANLLTVPQKWESIAFRDSLLDSWLAYTPFSGRPPLMTLSMREDQRVRWTIQSGDFAVDTSVMTNILGDDT